MNKYTIAALYKFTELEDFKSLQQPYNAFCSSVGIKGTLLLAKEGINGTVCGTNDAIDALIHFLQTDTRLSNLEYKLSYAEQMAFCRLKIKLKNEIVTLGIPSVKPTEQTGVHLNTKEWNTLLSDPDVILVDTRNEYETAIGMFKNARDPHTQNFRDFPNYVNNHLTKYKDKKIAMYCTGGIRCEKASSYMLQQGFKEVYQLKGGILKYIEETNGEENLWEGECFVFDNRVSVDNKLQKGGYHQCFGCRRPISEEDEQKGPYLQGVYCPHCYDTRSEEQKASAIQRQKQLDLAKKRGELYLARP